MDQLTGTAGREAVSEAGLTESIGFLLRMAQLKVFARFFEDLGEYGLRPGEFSVLITIARNPGMRQGQLAAAMSIKPAHMTKMVRGFEDQGLVTRRVPEDDRRAVELTLSPKGEAHVARLQPHFYEFDRSQQASLSDEEMVELRRLLRKFNGYPEKVSVALFDLGRQT